MKYLKYIKEITLFKNVDDTPIKKSVRFIPFEGKNTLIKDNRFIIDGMEFSAFFQKMTNKTDHWEGAHGIINDEGELVDKELNLSFSNTLRLMQIISNIVITFIEEEKPNIVVFNHRDMDNEIEKPTDRLNKRASIIYKYIKDRIPAGYELTYWYNNYYQDPTDSASTSCIIYRQGVDISPLIEDRVRIMI